MPNPSTFALSQPGMATGPHSPNGSLRGFTASGSGSAQSSLHGHGHSRSAQSSIHGHHRYSTDFNVAPMSMSMSMPRCIGRAQSGNRNTRPSLDMPFRPNHNASGPGAGGLVSEFGRLSLNGVVGNGSLNLDGFGNPNLQDSRSGFNGRASQSQGHAHVNNLNIDMPSPNSSLDFSNGGSVDYGHGNGTVNLNMNGLDYGRGSQSLDFGVGMHGQMQMLNFDSGRGSSLDLQGAGAAFDPAPGRRPLLNTAFSLSAGSSLSGPVSPTSSGDSSAFKTCIFCDTELHEGISLHNKLRHPFACQICRTDIASQRELDDHNIAVHGRNVPCSDCGRAFAKHHHLAQVRVSFTCSVFVGCCIVASSMPSALSDAGPSDCLIHVPVPIFFWHHHASGTFSSCIVHCTASSRHHAPLSLPSRFPGDSYPTRSPRTRALLARPPSLLHRSLYSKPQPRVTFLYSGLMLTRVVLPTAYARRAQISLPTLQQDCQLARSLRRPRQGQTPSSRGPRAARGAPRRADPAAAAAAGSQAAARPPAESERGHPAHDGRCLGPVTRHEARRRRQAARLKPTPVPTPTPTPTPMAETASPQRGSSRRHP
ncbi:hypothetical protein EXIGLDRAFT_36488 [Exidia glandulosa HHB12029]|uniref:C2H2-type domain-containing protein n=1 Tax=Exidia glandulosa HHB12029 TaxID=1314781 RepID=A0A166MTW0_EXIGL|nr:hypothetical protein EXIGLDRAFT_36488 [Exidia glandulosa HHB12029]